MKYKFKRKVLAIDIIIISLVIVAGVFAANWIYSNIVTVIGHEPILELTSDAGDMPIINTTFTLTAHLTLADSPMTGATIYFYLDQTNQIGTAVTDTNGIAIWQTTVLAGTHNYTAGYQIA